jgi:transcriptional regulator with XRE-family HTH domain
MSLRELARRVGVTHTHLSRAIRASDGKVVGGDLARRVALALDLPSDYFPEFRAAFVAERVHRDGLLRDRVYRELKRRG